MVLSNIFSSSKTNSKQQSVSPDDGLDQLLVDVHVLLRGAGVEEHQAGNRGQTKSSTKGSTVFHLGKQISAPTSSSILDDLCSPWPSTTCQAGAGSLLEALSSLSAGILGGRRPDQVFNVTPSDDYAGDESSTSTGKACGGSIRNSGFKSLRSARAMVSVSPWSRKRQRQVLSTMDSTRTRCHSEAA